MIFITVGTQLPFDRMIESLDDWSRKSGAKVFAQIGESDFEPKHMSFQKFISPAKAEELFESSSLVIAHAGMGSILTALKYQKPIVVMPRKALLGEHRNEHQSATAEWVKDLCGVYVASDEVELVKIISDLSGEVQTVSKIPPFAQEELLSYLAEQINGVV